MLTPLLTQAANGVLLKVHSAMFKFQRLLGGGGPSGLPYKCCYLHLVVPTCPLRWVGLKGWSANVGGRGKGAWAPGVGAQEAGHTVRLYPAKERDEKVLEPGGWGTGRRPPRG